MPRIFLAFAKKFVTSFCFLSSIYPFPFSMPDLKKTSWIVETIQNSHFLLWSNLCSIIGAAASLLLWKVDPTPEMASVRDIVLGIVLISLVVVLTFAVARLSMKLEKLTISSAEEVKTMRDGRERSRLTHLAGLHQITHKLRDVCWASEHRNAEESHMHFVQKICTSVLTETRALLISHFETKDIKIAQDVSVTLKLKLPTDEAQKIIESATGEQISDDKKPNSVTALDSFIEFESKFRLVTLARDGYTLQMHGDEREVLKRVYSVTANTAFVGIVRSDSKVYVQNDLKSLGESYDNENKEHSKFYNSTLVVPIRYKRDHSTRSTVFGMLCVDSKNDGKIPLYNKEETYEIVAHSADLLAVVLFGLHQYQKAQMTERVENIRIRQNPKKA